MKSLRTQLLLGVSLATTTVLLASCVTLYMLITRAIWTQFDDALAEKARSMSSLAAEDEDGLEWELSDASLPEFTRSDQPEYYQVLLPNSGSLARSPSLNGGNLIRVQSRKDAPSFAFALLPDGRDGRIVQLHFTPRQEFETEHAAAPTTLTLIVARGIAPVTSTLNRVRTVLVAVCVATVLLTAGLLAAVVRRGLRPVDELGSQIGRVGESDLSARIEPKYLPHELQPVADRLNDLLVRLESAFQRERRFTGDVAHELRTPLAGLRATLELALDRNRTGDEYRGLLNECLNIDLHMQRIVENLLHLARADANQLEVHREPVELADLARECWRPLAEQAAARGLNVEWSSRDGAPVTTDREKLQLVLRNVLENAVNYVDDRGRLEIAIGANNGTTEMRVSNTGCTLLGDQVEHVFDRFWRADPSNSRPGETHCGLGLPLCRALVQRLDGSITAASESGVFTITLRLPTNQ